MISFPQERTFTSLAVDEWRAVEVNLGRKREHQGSASAPHAVAMHMFAHFWAQARIYGAIKQRPPPYWLL
jgi:hypothetical protein